MKAYNNRGALKLRIGFWGKVYYTYIKGPPNKKNIYTHIQIYIYMGNYFGPSTIGAFQF